MSSITVRFTEANLHKAIVTSAKKNRRSINSEILRAVEYYLENSPEAQVQEDKSAKKPKDKQA